MQDCNLSVGGVTQVKTDRQNFFPQAPFSPAIFNVPIKPNTTSDIDNFRNDLLKQYCKNVGSQGGRFDTPFDTMKKYGQKKKGGAGSYGISDIDNAINEATKDTTDAVGQVKYLLCQQADGLIAPPKPPIIKDGTSAGQLFKQVYLANTYSTIMSIIFAILSGVLIFRYIIRVKSTGIDNRLFMIVLIGGILLSIVLGLYSSIPYCYDTGNDYYDPLKPSIFGDMLKIYGSILLIALITIEVGRANKLPNVFYFGLIIPLIALFSIDIWMAVFLPQLFIIAVIIWRIYTYTFLSDSNWSMPFVSLYGSLVPKIIDFVEFVPPTKPASTWFDIKNEQLFKAFV